MTGLILLPDAVELALVLLVLVVLCWILYRAEGSK